jgi:hypothetical protein
MPKLAAGNKDEKTEHLSKEKIILYTRRKEFCILS